MHFTSEYELITPGCGCHQFAVLASVKEKWQNTHKSWWCPQCGSCRHYTGETNDQRRLREAQQKATEAQLRASQAEAKAASVVKSYKKIRDRVKNGVCPCCNRTFENLARHMSTQHPDFGSSDTLKNIRLAYGLTQSALADEIGVKSAYISLYENDRPVPQRARDHIEHWIAAEAK
jgi:DNA-binding XRE family transcriptional regulator